MHAPPAGSDAAPAIGLARRGGLVGGVNRDEFVNLHFATRLDFRVYIIARVLV